MKIVFENLNFFEIEEALKTLKAKCVNAGESRTYLIKKVEEIKYFEDGVEKEP